MVGLNIETWNDGYWKSKVYILQILLYCLKVIQEYRVAPTRTLEERHRIQDVQARYFQKVNLNDPIYE